MKKPLNYSTVERTIMEPEKALPVIWYKWIWNRLHRLNYNYLQITTGDTGSGKTMSNIVDAYILNPRRFNASAVCLGMKEFLDFIKDSKSGDTCVVTEGGVVMSSRQWYSISNIMGGQALQTFREKNLGVWFDLPDLSMLDIQVRKLMNAQAICKRYSNKEVIQYMYKISVDRKQSGKIYYPYFSFMYKGRRYYMPYLIRKRSQFNIIPKKIMKEINKKVSEFKEKILEKTTKEAELLDRERFGEYKEKTEFDYAREVLKEPDKYKLNGKISLALIRAHLGLSQRKASNVYAIIKKGVLSHQDMCNISNNNKNKEKSAKKGKDLTKCMKSKVKSSSGEEEDEN